MYDSYYCIHGIVEILMVCCSQSIDQLNFDDKHFITH